MNYRSIADMNDTILSNLARLPRGIDLVVGVPRSGLLAANLLSLALNVPLTDVDGLLARRVLAAGRTRRPAAIDRPPDGPRRIVVIDDSIFMGHSMTAVRRRIEEAGVAGEITTVAVYGNLDAHPDADVVLEAVPQPRLFQWNVFHHGHLEHCCVDIDGVLCCDPSPSENDDGPAYERFLVSATPMIVPTRPIGWLVTSRLEKYRRETEAWLEAAGIEYRHLVMLDLPSMAERRRSRAHGSFKASVYRDCEALLFIESEHEQAIEIAEGSGKPVLSLEAHRVVEPGPSALAARQALSTLPRRVRIAKGPLTDVRSLKLVLRGALGNANWRRLKALAGGRSGSTRGAS